MGTSNAPTISPTACMILVSCLALLRPDSAAAGETGAAGQPAGVRNLIVNPDFSRSSPAEKSSGPDRRWLPSYEKEPFLPLGWEVQPSGNGAGVLSVADDDGRATLEVRTKKGQQVRLRQYVEVVPKTSYTCGVSVKGRGSVTLRSFACIPATNQDFGAKDGKAGDAWTKLSLRAVVGYHRHVLALMVDVRDDADVLLRGAEVTAPLPDGALPETLVTTKPAKDQSTLYIEDFDGPSCSFPVDKDCELTGTDAGRFGRGLLVTPKSGGAKARLHFGKLPETGTIEFWYKPETKLPENGNPNSYICPFVLTTPTAFKQFVVMLNSWATSVIFGFQTQQWDGRHSWAGTFSLGNSGWANWKAATWHHVAGSWDKQATRLYVDGALQGIRILGGEPTEWTCPASDIQRPEGEALDLLLPTACTVDEIRVSSGLRYGPFIPVGAISSPLVVERPEPTPAAGGGAYLQTPERDLEAHRNKAILPVPDPKADYVFGADTAKPAWQGMSGMKREKDCFGAGVEGIALDVNQEWDRPSAIYWKLEGIQPGKYYAGLWQETQRRQWDWQATDPRVSEYNPDSL
ncbi:MAG: hypothetical protein NTW87_07850, partial [Planctomycetota bacterium]|nr:hypothetical protein [Planctomycetota bacterium]